jgi:hypothetical protein
LTVPVPVADVETVPARVPSPVLAAYKAKGTLSNYEVPADTNFVPPSGSI